MKVLEYHNLLRQNYQIMVQYSNQNCQRIPSKIMFSRQSQILLLSLAAFLVVQSVGAFQSSSRAPWQSSLLGKEIESTTSLIKYGHRISSTGCASTRAHAQQSENADETSFLMKPFSTASGEIVYVLCLLSQTSSRHCFFPFQVSYVYYCFFRKNSLLPSDACIRSTLYNVFS